MLLRRYRYLNGCPELPPAFWMGWQSCNIREKQIAERICYYMENRAGGKMKTDCILFSSEYGELAKSKGAEEWFILLGREQAR